MATVALVGTLATAVLSKDLPILEGLLGCAVLEILRFIIAWVAKRATPIEAAIKSEPRVQRPKGTLKQWTLLAERVTQKEAKAAIGRRGIGDVAAVAVVVLQADGSFSVIPSHALGEGSAFRRIRVAFLSH